MEILGGILVLGAIIFGFAILQIVLQAGAKSVHALARAATGKGSLSDNFGAAFRGMSSLEVRFREERLGESHDGSMFKQIDVKGLFPIGRQTRIGFVTSILDKTDEEYAPVLCAFEGCQEVDSQAYQLRSEVGSVSPNQGFIGWVRIGSVFPEILEPPFGGLRKMCAIVRMIDLDDPPKISLGFHSGDEGLLWQRLLEFEVNFDGKGYLGAAEFREEAGVLCIQIAMAVAMADRSLADTEGLTIKRWIERSIATHPDGRRQEVKSSFNNALKQAYGAARKGELSLSPLIERLNEIGEKSTKYDAIELCLEIMTADGVVDSAELTTIRRIAAALELDFDEIERMRDRQILVLENPLDDQTSIEELLGIDPDWPKDRIKKHLRDEFQKWNNRLTALPEGEERRNAQGMLDMISDARRNMADELARAREIAEAVRFRKDVRRGDQFHDRSVGRVRRNLLTHSLRVSIALTPKLAQGVTQACRRLAIPMSAVDAFIYRSPEIQAESFVGDRTACVVTFSSSLVDLLNQSEFEFVVGHEIGHFLLDHERASTPVRESVESLMQQRYQEVSVDRIGLLACGSINAAVGALMKVASGLSSKHLRDDVGTFIAQLKHLDVSPDDESGTHPSALVRCRALLWFSMGDSFSNGIGHLSKSQQETIDRAVERDLDRYVDKGARERIRIARDDVMFWMASMSILDAGIFSKAAQDRMQGRFGEAPVVGLKRFLTDLSASQARDHVLAKLAAARHLLESEVPLSIESEMEDLHKQKEDLVRQELSAPAQPREQHPRDEQKS